MNYQCEQLSWAEDRSDKLSANIIISTQFDRLLLLLLLEKLE